VTVGCIGALKQVMLLLLLMCKLINVGMERLMTDEVVHDAAASPGSTHNPRMSGSRRPGLPFNHVCLIIL